MARSLERDAPISTKPLVYSLIMTMGLSVGCLLSCGAQALAAGTPVTPGTTVTLPFERPRMPRWEAVPELLMTPLLLSQQQQIELGQQVAKEQGHESRATTDKALSAVATRMIGGLKKYRGGGLIEGWDWQVKALRTTDGSINALALPGGRIYVTDGLLKLAKGEPNQLAAVVGHEMAHITAQHSAKKLFSAGLLAKAANWALQQLGGGGEGEWLTGVAGELTTRLGTQLVEMKLSREAEYRADRIGFELLAAAGYSPQQGLRVLGKLKSLESAGTGKAGVLGRAFSTHPPTSERIQRLRAQFASPNPALAEAK
ncbi:MAG: M48 family metallopeptidase [Armatimonadota bacterium]